jgi:hypothetical protein
MSKPRRESGSNLVEPYFEEGCEEPLFRHGQPPLHKTAYARIAELVSTTPAEGTTYWTFKTLTDFVSQRMKA